MGGPFSLPTLPSLLVAPNLPFIHRDLSWLQFNERVLSEAELKSNPLLERAKFLAISSNNLDEFFMIRYASLVRSIHSAIRTDPHLALRLIRIRDTILKTVSHFARKQAQILHGLSLELNDARVHILRGKPTTCHIRNIEKAIFDKQVRPRLSSPEPFNPIQLNSLENLQFALIFENSCWVKISRSIPTIYSHWDKTSKNFYIFFLDDILCHHLGQSFGFSSDPLVVRLTRDGDFTIDIDDEDTESIPDIVRQGIGIREKGTPIRLQFRGKLQKQLFNAVTKALRISPSQITQACYTVCLNGIGWLRNLIPDHLSQSSKFSYPVLVSTIPKPLRNPRNIFDRLAKKDLLLHHPYDSFDGFVTWMRAACEDPHVTQIEQTVYRMDTLSAIVDALKSAAHTKKVRVIIELRARFDELNNLRLTDELRKAGVEVTFGFGKLKLHGKVALITRVVNQKTQLFAHLSTGNYNATTARQYTDLAILTSQKEICSDVRYFFDQVWNGKIPNNFKCLLPAPSKLHRRLLNYIQGEAHAAREGRPAHIVAKVNALVDPTLIQHLYAASQSGVQVDLIVRGACSLIPGVKGLSENIRVISVIDRFLEHSRIYYFSSAKKIYLSSADWMPRNFFSRLELAFPILDPDIYQYIEKFIIPIYLSDTVKARELTPQGVWKRRSIASVKKRNWPSQTIAKLDRSVRSQFLLETVAVREYQGTPLGRRNL